MEANRANKEIWHRITSIREIPYCCNKRNEVVIKAFGLNKDSSVYYFQIHKNRKSLVYAIKGLFEDPLAGEIYWAYVQDFNK